MLFKKYLFIALLLVVWVSAAFSGERELVCHAFQDKFYVSADYDKVKNATLIQVVHRKILGNKVIFEESMAGSVEALIASCLFDVTYDGIILIRQGQENLLEFAVFKPTKDELELTFPWRKFPHGRIFIKDQEVMLFRGVRFSILFLNDEGFLELEPLPIDIVGEDTAIKDTLLRFKLTLLGEIEFASVNLSKGVLQVKKGGDLLFIRGDLNEEVEKIEFFADDPQKTESDLCESPLPNVRNNFKNEPGLKMAIEIGMKTVIIPIEVIE